MDDPLNNVVNVHMNLDDDGCYQDFMDDLVQQLANYTEHAANKAEYESIPNDNILLPKQITPEAPARWMHVHLTAKDTKKETKTVTLAVRDDNLYLVGFKKESADMWYEIGTIGKDNPVLTTSVFLGCAGTYDSLAGGKENLINVKLGERCAAEAVFHLYSYNEGDVVGTETKRHLACLIVMICEAARMSPIQDRVLIGWDDRTTAINKIQVNYVGCWKKTSRAVLKSRQKWPQFGFASRSSALGVVRLLLNAPTKKKTSAGPGGGRANNGDGGGANDRSGSASDSGPDQRSQDPAKKKKKQEKQLQKKQKGKGKQMQQQEEPSQPPASNGRGGNKRKPSQDGPEQKQQDKEEQRPAEGSSTMFLGLEEDEEEDVDAEEEEQEQDSDDEEEEEYDEEQIIANDGEEEEFDEEDEEESDEEDPGQFLLEVFSVSATAGERVVGTIAVFDGKRGQIIYSDDGQGDAPQKDSQDNLVLTGPYKAISAGGCVSVKFTDRSSNVGRATLWDAYNDSDGDTYDKVLNKHITLGAIKITVTYAVLSNAVEADVQVEMKLNRGLGGTSTTAHVHGEITAHYLDHKISSTLLFSGTEQALEAFPSSDGLVIPVPLPRSVLVAPLLHPAPFRIHIKLVCSNHDVSLDGEVTFSKLKRDNMMEIEGLGVDVQVKIIAPDICALPEDVGTRPPSVNALPEEDDMASPSERPTTGIYAGPKAAATMRRQELHKSIVQAWKDGPPVVVVDLDLDLDRDYARCIQDLRENFTNHGPDMAGYDDWMKGRLLPVQQPKQPARWILIILMARSETDEEPRHITLIIRDDNVNLVGFMNQNEELFELGIEGRNEHLIKGSTFLGCDVSYRGLVGGSRNLVGLELGKSSAVSAVCRLSEYKHLGPADAAAVGKDLARLCVMFCESARMNLHYDTVNDGWNVGSRIQEQHVDYTRAWAYLSRYRSWLHSPVLHLLLNRPLPRGLPGLLRGGRALVQVFSVHAEDGVVGTITVFDGKRAQIIYKHCDGYLSQGRSVRRFSGDLKELALSGPYRAISADASFAIQVDGISETDASRDGDMVWDWYTDDDPFADNEVSTRAIITSTGRTVEVAYAVYKNAMEATMQVNLVLPAGIYHVYGKVTAQNLNRYEEIVLFSREPEEKVELVPSDSSTFPVPLARSVVIIAVPLHNPPLMISVDLHVASANNESDKINLTGHTYFRFEGAMYCAFYDDIFLPMGWTHPDTDKGIGGHPEQGTTSYSSHLQDTDGASTPDSLQATEQTSVQKGMVQVNVTSRSFHSLPRVFET